MPLRSRTSSKAGSKTAAISDRSGYQRTRLSGGPAASLGVDDMLNILIGLPQESILLC